MFQDFPVLENATINFKDFQVFQDPHGPCCIDRLISRSKQNRESLTYLASHYNERLLRIRKVSVTASDVKKYWGKKSISSKKVAKIFRNAEKFIDIGECAETVKHANVTIPAKGPAYLQRVSRSVCAVIFEPSSSSRYMASNWPVCICGVRRRETTPSLAAL